VTIVKMYTWNLLRGQILIALITHTKETMWGAKDVNRLNCKCSVMLTYIKTLNIYDFMCQIFLSKSRKDRWMGGWMDR
jgi:hypothetical protein